MSVIKLYLSAVLFLFMTTGCATMIRGTTQSVAFDSDPPGATVTFQASSCITPCEIASKRGFKPETVEFKLEGHEGYLVEITSSTTEDMNELIPSLILGAVFIVPLAYDQASGVLQDWPKKIVATLPKKGQGTAQVRITR
jgi:hypothetical protein